MVVPCDTEHEGVATVAVVTSCTCALCIARMFDSASLEARTGKQATFFCPWISVSKVRVVLSVILCLKSYN